MKENKISDEVREYMAKNASKGGKARAEKLSPERRKEIAVKAASARWPKKIKS